MKVLPYALQTVSMIVNKRKKDDAYRRIAIKRAGVKDFSGAEQSIQQIRDNRLQDRTYASLARLRARSGDLSGGLQILQNIGNSSIEDATLRELSTELAKLGRFADSALVTTRIRDEKEKSYALEGLSVEQARVGDLSAALVKISPRFLWMLFGIGDCVMCLLQQRIMVMLSLLVMWLFASIQAVNGTKPIVPLLKLPQQVETITMLTIPCRIFPRPDEKALAMVSMARYRLRQGDERQALALLEDARRSCCYHCLTSNPGSYQCRYGYSIC